MLGPVAIAQGTADGEPAPGPTAPPLQASASLDLRRAVSIDALREHDEVRETCGLPVFTAEYWSSSVPDGWFRFSEPTSDTACGEMVLAVSHPPTARSTTLHFAATRVIESQPDGPFPVDIRQEIHLYDGTETVETIHYYDRSSGPRLAARSFQVDVGASITAIGWYFEDAGPVTTDPAIPVNPFSSYALNATISALRLDYDEITIPLPDANIVAEVDDDSTRTFTSVLPLEIDPTLLADATGTLTVQVDRAWDLVEVQTPDGSVIDADALLIVEASGRRSYLLPEEIVAASLQGPLVLSWSHIAQLPPPTPPAPPTQIDAVAYAAFAGPLAMAAFATYGVATYSRAAVGPYARTAGALIFVLVAAFAYAGLILVEILTAVGFHALATWPLSTPATLLYGQLVLLALAFLAIGLLSTRYLMRSMQTDLSHRKEQAAALRQAMTDLERSNAELEQFAAIASHDLQEPLRKVAGFASLLRRRYEGRLDEKADRYMETMTDAVQRMQRLIKDLLALSLVGVGDDEKTAVALDQVADRVISDLQAQVDETDAKIIHTGLPTVTAHYGQMTRLLQNLVSNALKFRHPDRTPIIEIDARRDGDAWDIRVQDNGIGIDEPYQGKIFEIFERVHGRDKYPGTGIGLALCKKIAEQAGGSLTVRSDGRTGSCFNLRLPDG